MEEFRPTENILTKWIINKTAHLMLASIVFFIPLAIFIASFVGIFVLLRSTNLALLIVPLLLFLPIIPATKEFWDIYKIYQESTQVYVTDTGIYVRYLDRKDKYDFISWYSIKQYDIVDFPKHSLLQKMITVPTRFVFQNGDGGETMSVDAIDSDAEVLRNYLHERNIPFGFKTN